MLIAMALTLLLMAGTLTVFGVVTAGIANGRSIMESAERLRAARNRLQTDLASATVIPVPPRRPEADEGYLEYIEGPQRDRMFDSTVNNNLMGDCDDVLALTVRSRGEPFVGRIPLISVSGKFVKTLQSYVAEVIWFALPNGQTISTDTPNRDVQLYTLYRRVRLVLPQTPPMDMIGTTLQEYDLSSRMEQRRITRLVSNSLGDLTKPENRWGHGSYASNFTPPYVFGEPFDDKNGDDKLTAGEVFTNLDDNAAHARPNSITGLPTPLSEASGRLGDDVVLTNVVGWDIQAFDPNAPLMLADDGQTVLVPSDPGYSLFTRDNVADMFTASRIPSSGAYVDLGYAPGILNGTKPWPGGLPIPFLYGFPAAKSLLPNFPPTYDTWSMHYEQMLSKPGDADATAAGGSGVNGLDDDNDGVVDNPEEWKTGPPYATPLRGLQIRIRVYEPDSQQVRSVTVVQDFLAE